jgi:hypothetical protein
MGEPKVVNDYFYSLILLGRNKKVQLKMKDCNHFGVLRIFGLLKGMYLFICVLLEENEKILRKNRKKWKLASLIGLCGFLMQTKV